MTRANDRFEHRPAAPAATRRAVAAHGPLGPVLESLAGILRESAGLVRNVAGLGIVLVLDTTPPKRRPVARPLPAPDTTNIIRFPAHRSAKSRK
ncbi:hypothetical protein [Bradyrhizobium uaiense]|uniref:Uncharacterized protein n=1 Tax=Bradyrhizobium uaiense TaxID=2594946 RepID=A0A6P1BFE6_9BRAD|nr:hypothetical protein [Bradyrhizobium uaiense]NEU97158.1 hypothetical protein [Bradyrhizobium uaiense]